MTLFRSHKDARASGKPEDNRATPDAASDPLEAAELEPGDASPPMPASPPAAGAGGDELSEMRDRWLRTEADLQNYRRRAARDVEEARRSAEESVLLEVIGFLDDLDRATESARTSGADPAWLQGVEFVSQRMRDYLARNGVTPVETIGSHFDPHQHEALLELDAPDAAPGTVVSVIRNGYRRGERVLRAARVAVAREPATS